MQSNEQFPAPDDTWRFSHMGCLLGDALRRFDDRVLQLVSQNEALPLKLANYAARGVVTAAQIHLTRHLSSSGSRLSEMSQSAGLSKQAMAQLMQQCEAAGWVERQSDPLDARAQRIVYTESGKLWQQAFAQAVQQAEAEMAQELGTEICAVIRLGLEAYAQNLHIPQRKRARTHASP